MRPDGEVRFVHSHTDVIRDEQGRICRTFGIAQDMMRGASGAGENERHRGVGSRNARERAEQPNAETQHGGSANGGEVKSVKEVSPSPCSSRS